MIDIKIEDITLADVFGQNGYIAQRKEGYEVRDQQFRVAEVTEQAIKEERMAIIEAGTGVGKSFALVVPAVLSGKRCVISTETNTLLDQYIEKDLPFLQSVLPVGFKYAKAKGKSNYACKMKIDEFNMGSGLISMFADSDEVNSLAQWATTTRIGDRSEPRFGFSNESWNVVGCDEMCPRRQCGYYGEGAKGETECFAYQARKDFLEADVVVTNHTLMLINADLGGDVVLGQHPILIVDEAHTLAEQAQKTIGFELKQKSISSFCKYCVSVTRKAGMHLTDVFESDEIIDAERWFFEQFRRLTKQQMPFRDIPALIIGEAKKASEPVIRLIEILRASLNSVMPNNDEDQQLLEELDDRALDHIKNIRGLFEPEENWLPFCELSGDPEERRVELHYKPVDVAPILLRKIYNQRKTTVLASATMSVAGRFNFPISELGLINPITLMVGSPFDYAKQCTGYYPCKLPDPSSPAYHTALADEVTKILAHTSGRAFVLFTSYRDLQAVYELVSPHLRYAVKRQGDLPRPALVEWFKKDIHSVLFGTRSFFTGVDIPGDALSCVILAKAPFRPPDEPLFRAKCDLIKARGGNDFIEYALPLMVNDLRQAFGRLIRNKTDIGFWAFLDSRAINKPYFRQIIGSLPTMKVKVEL